MIAGAGDAKLQLAFDAAITGAVMDAALCHPWRLKEFPSPPHGSVHFRQLRRACIEAGACWKSIATRREHL
jgi:hypothetical protein